MKTFIDGHSVRPDIDLAPGATITFQPDDEDWESAIRVTMEDGVLTIHGIRSLAVLPASANVIHVKADPPPRPKPKKKGKKKSTKVQPGSLMDKIERAK